MSITETASREIKSVGHPVKIRKLHVKETQLLAPRLKQITLTGAELAGFKSLSPDDHIKVFFPAEGETEVHPPQLGPNGMEYVEGKSRPEMRDYTPVQYDADKNELTLIFFLHGKGPASAWAQNAVVGSELTIAGPRGSRIVPESFDWYLMIGDETAIPAFRRRLKEFHPSARGILFLEVENPESAPQLERPKGVQIHWLYRQGLNKSPQEAVMDVLAETEFSSGDYFSWVIGETSRVRVLADYLIQSKGARKEWMKATGYWDA